MTSREFFVWTLKDEVPRFERVFKAVRDAGEDNWDWRPHPKSRNTEELIRHTFGRRLRPSPSSSKKEK